MLIRIAYRGDYDCSKLKQNNMTRIYLVKEKRDYNFLAIFYRYTL